jgi:7-cyano-7-deazaguanine synthase
MKSRVVVPVSGGMDSAVLLYQAAKSFDEVHCLIFDYNQRHSREIECAKYLCNDAKKINKNIFYKVVDTSFIRQLAPTSSLTNDAIETPDVRKIAGEAQPKSYVPFRNLIFLSIALSHAEAVGAVEVWHGATAVDSLAGYWDASGEFMPTLNSLCDLNREHRIAVMTPLINSDKCAIVNMGVELNVPFEHTYTCYSGEELSDATSASSSLRIKGFIDAGYKDPVKYKQQAFLDDVYAANNCKDIAQNK